MQMFRIKERREALGLDPKTVATALGLSEEEYLGREEGRADWFADELVIIRKVLQTSINDLTN